MKVLLLAPSGAAHRALAQLDLDPESDEVVVIAGAATDSEVRTVIVRPALRAWTTRIGRVLGGSVLGRNALRLTPFDAGRRFAAAVRRSPGARREFGDTDLIVALERDALLAGWQATRRWAPDEAAAVYGVPPAQALLATARG